LPGGSRPAEKEATPSVVTTGDCSPTGQYRVSVGGFDGGVTGVGGVDGGMGVAEEVAGDAGFIAGLLRSAGRAADTVGMVDVAFVAVIAGGLDGAPAAEALDALCADVEGLTAAEEGTCSDAEALGAGGMVVTV
jgi:hypothetical protein